MPTPTVAIEVDFSGNQLTKLATFEGGASLPLLNSNPTGFNSVSPAWNKNTQITASTPFGFDSVVDTGAKLSATSGAANDGALGLEVDNSNTTVAAGKLELGTDITECATSFWFNDNGALTGGSTTYIVGAYDGATLIFAIRQDAGGDFDYYYKTDTGTQTGNLFNADSAYHHIYMYWKASSGANDGILLIFIDGVLTLELTNADTDTLVVDHIYYGNVYSTAVSPSGTYYFDSFHADAGPGAPFPSVLAANIGSYGAGLFIVGSNANYGALTSGNNETSAGIVFHLDPNTITMATNNEFVLVQGRGAGSGSVAFDVNLKYDGSNYKLYANIYDDASAATATSEYTITDAFHIIKVAWIASSGTVNNGILSLIIDGTLKQTLSGKNNDGQNVNEIRYGAVAGVDAGTYGLMYLDMVEFSGFADICPDCLTSPGIALNSQGIMSNGPTSHMPSPASLDFQLNNSSTNTAGLLGYYSPDNDNVARGFEIGKYVRLRTTYNSVDEFHCYAEIDDIEPVPGSSRSRRVLVTASDYIAKIADENISKVVVQESKRDDQLLATLTANASREPLNTSYATGADTYTIAFHDLKDENTKLLRAANNCMNSGLGYLFVTGNTTDGETLVYQTRQTRAVGITSSLTLNNTMQGIQVTRSKNMIFNRVKAVSYPAEIDAAATTVLCELQTSVEISPGDTKTITLRYRDPNQKARRFSGKNFNTPLTADTDFTFSSVDGSGNDLNSDLGIVLTAGANSCDFALTNNSGVVGYVNTLQLRGKGIYLDDPLEVIVEDATSQGDYGTRQLVFNMSYQDSANVASDVSNAHLSKYKDPRTFVNEVTVIANTSDALLTGVLALRPGMMITLSEDVTGLSALDYFINGRDMKIYNKSIVKVTYVVEPAGISSVLILNDSVFAVLDSDEARLGW